MTNISIDNKANVPIWEALRYAGVVIGADPGLVSKHRFDDTNPSIVVSGQVKNSHTQFVIEVFDGRN